jgi:hypothetical protein
MMTNDEQLSQLYRWRDEQIAKGYDVTTTMWEYGGRQVPMISVWPAKGSEEELRLLHIIADFLWDIRHLAKHPQNRKKKESPKKPRPKRCR